MAPSLLGQALPMIEMAAPASLNERWELIFRDVEMVGEDLRILARLAGGLSEGIE
jgi:diaminohydroxyphosphoribosylaminopyrimidine deaminase/5-amino-6-(5-phosphoribosylamino)uracil reductase